MGGGEGYCQAISEGLAINYEVEVYTTNVVSVNPLKYATDMVEIKNGVKIYRLSSAKFLAGIYGRKRIDNGSNVLFKALNSMDTWLTWPQTLVERSISSSIPHSLPWLTNRLKAADIIVLFNIISGMSSLSYLASRFNRKPFVIFPMYHVGLSTYERPSLLKILQDASLAICSTEFEKQALIKKGIEPRKLRVVNEGTQTPFVEAAEVNHLEEIIGKEENQLILMYVGRRDYDKGYPHVLSAVYQLVKQGIPIRLIICGQGNNGADRADYLFLQKHGAIIDLGVAEEQTKFAAMSISDAVILPSRAETYPLVFVEAWLLGKPVVGARIGSVSTIVREGIDGLLVDFGDILGLMRAIRFLYDNAGERIEMGESGKVRARKDLTFDKTIKHIRNIFDEFSRHV